MKTKPKEPRVMPGAIAAARAESERTDRLARAAKKNAQSAKAAVKAAKKALKLVEKAAKKARKEARRARKSLASLVARQAAATETPPPRRSAPDTRRALSKAPRVRARTKASGVVTADVAPMPVLQPQQESPEH